jgi:hypothetical protein
VNLCLAYPQLVDHNTPKPTGKGETQMQNATPPKTNINLRGLDRCAALCIAIHPEAAAQSAERARILMRSKISIHPTTLAAACQSLMMNSDDAEERAAAQQVLSQMEAAA